RRRSTGWTSTRRRFTVSRLPGGRTKRKAGSTQQPPRAIRAVSAPSPFDASERSRPIGEPVRAGAGPSRPSESRPRTMLRRSAALGQVARRVDQRDVREGLREIAQQPPGRRVVLLRQQAHVVAQAKETLEDLPCLRGPPLQREVVGEPERA